MSSAHTLPTSEVIAIVIQNNGDRNVAETEMLIN